MFWAYGVSTPGYLSGNVVCRELSRFCLKLSKKLIPLLTREKVFIGGNNQFHHVSDSAAGLNCKWAAQSICLLTHLPTKPPLSVRFRSSRETASLKFSALRLDVFTVLNKEGDGDHSPDISITAGSEAAR